MWQIRRTICTIHTHRHFDCNELSEFPQIQLFSSITHATHIQNDPKSTFRNEHSHERVGKLWNSNQVVQSLLLRQNKKLLSIKCVKNAFKNSFWKRRNNELCVCVCVCWFLDFSHLPVHSSTTYMFWWSTDQMFASIWEVLDRND